MRPTLRQMEYIVTVQRLGRFGLAAEFLGVSQPSLSAQLALVEADLGITLFERGRKGVQATAKGQEFIRRAEAILNAVQDLRHAMAHDLPFAGRLRLGVLPSIGPYLLPRVVQRIHAGQPDLRILVREENTRDLEAGLKSGRLDAIISTPEDHPNTRQQRLFHENLWLAVATDDALAAADKAAGPESFQGRRLLTLDNGHRLSRIVYALAAETGGVVSDEYEGTSLDSILLMAATGAGVAILPQLFATRQAIYRDEVVVKPIRHDQAGRDIALLVRSDAPPHQGMDLLVQTLRQVAQELGLETLGISALG